MNSDERGGKADGKKEKPGEVGARAVHPRDRLRSTLQAFRCKVDRALRKIEEARSYGNLGVSFSGGKDSTVLLDLVRQIDPVAPAAFFDSGCELRQTHEVVSHYGVLVLHPSMSLLQMCRQGGYWGYTSPTDPEAEFDFGKVLIEEPAQRFVKQFGLRVLALGMRAEESAVRCLTARRRGELYYVRGEGLWHCCPLFFWSVEDIWAYIASRNIVYNTAYDRFTEIGIPRERQRISTLLGSDVASYGRYVYLKQIDIALWNRLAMEFPKIRSYT